METFDYQLLDTLINRVFVIEDITLGTDEANYLVRYRGHLRSDSETAYDQLTDWLKPYHLTPLFRWDAEQHAILLIPNLPQSKPSNPNINLILGILTLISVLYTGAVYNLQGQPLPSDFGEAIVTIISNGWPFAASILAILGAHEFGHYLVGRYHGAKVTLPYFIPFPSAFGTLGAFINMKEPPKNRKVLLDIGVAGPLAGLIVAIPILLLGLSLSTLNPIQVNPGQAVQLEGNSIIYLLSKLVVFGQLLPAPVSYDGVQPIFYWLQYFFTSTPLPRGGLDVSINSVAWAGWAGLLVTAMNLIPAGQLDGGHMLYVLFGRKRAQRIFPFVLGTLIVLTYFWLGWLLWAGIIFFLGRSYAEPLDEITPLDNRRKALAILALIVFLLTFSPVPLTIIAG
jgi:membrane-associated protease RseP (regulator of RpoE activity)